MPAHSSKPDGLSVSSNDTLASLKAMPTVAQKPLFKMREIIFNVGEDEQIGGVEETLKWNQPAYLPRLARVGTTVRIGYNEKHEQCILYGHCQSTLIDQWRNRYADVFDFLGNRGLLFSVHNAVPEEELADCVWLALTYHQRKT